MTRSIRRVEVVVAATMVLAAHVVRAMWALVEAGSPAIC
jgi:hypothetical protein